MLTFSEILAPTDEGSFFASYWERAPLVVRGDDPGRFGSVFSLDDLEPLLADFGRPYERQIRVAKHGAETRWLPPDVPASVDSMVAAAGRGHTLNVNAVSQRHAGVRALVGNLFATFRCLVTANLYVTPPSAQAFAPHFDTHDVFALQLAGSKRWRVYPPAVEAPLGQTTGDPDVDPERCGEVLVDARLQAGDLLYVPRGFVHEVFTEPELSLHISLGVHPPSLRSLLIDLVESSAYEQAELRRTPLPPAYLDDPERLGALLRERLAALAETDMTTVVDRIAATTLQSAPELPGAGFRSLELELDVETPLEKRQGAICRVVERATEAGIYFQGNGVVGPPRIGPALRFVAEREGPFTARDLPGGLAESERLVLARRLLREGLLTLGA